MFAQAFPGRANAMNVAATAAPGPWQLTADMAVMLENIEMPPLQSLGVIIAKDLPVVFGATELLPKPWRLFDLHEDAIVFIEAAIRDRPLIAQAQHLMEEFFGCHPNR